MPMISPTPAPSQHDLKQQYFTTAVTALLNQGERSLTSYGTCAYRGQHDRKCAVGHLIPEDKYERKFEGYSANQTILSAIQPEGGWPDDDRSMIEFLLDLQRAHDDSCGDFREGFLLRCREIAEDHDLKMPPVVDFGDRPEAHSEKS